MSAPVIAAESGSPALGRVLLWLSAHAGFPRSRLPVKAEAMICMAALAAAEAAGESAGGKPRAPSSYDRAALRAHTINRSHTQFKSDNSSKV
jgi:hypothetical protein